MNLSWLDDFLALAASGNFSRAADQRHMTQPAFSRRIRALEDWLGVLLFDRGTQPATLTDAGRWFTEVAQETLRRIVRLPEEARAIAGAGSATLRFAATHALSLTFLPTWLRRLEARTPVGPIELVSDVLPRCEALMQQGRVQFMLCHGHDALPGQLDASAFDWLKVGSDALVPVSSVAPGGGPLHPLDATGNKAVPLLDYSAESGLGRLMHALRVDSPRYATLQTLFTAHLATVLRTMAIQGRGIAWLPRSLIDDDLREGRLIAASSTDAALSVDIRLFRPKACQSAIAEEFWRAAAG